VALAGAGGHHETMPGRHVAALALAALAAAALVWGLGRRGGDGSEPVAPSAAPAPPPVAPVVPTPPAAPTCVAGTTSNAGEHAATAVRAIRPLVALTAPDGKRLARFDVRNANGVRTVFSVRATRVGADCRPRWFRVQLPIRPNGITGWVRARDVQAFVVDTRVTVDLSERRVVVARGGKVVLDVRAAIGTPETPTPVGRFYVNQRLWANDPSGPWGPGGVGISAFSPVLVNWAQGGPIAIHGTNQPYLIGNAISHGCVRVSNFALLRLMKLAPEGTPVVIRA